MNGYNFTERVRKVLSLAREEAALLHHEYVGTEHILLALVREGEGVAMTALRNLGISPEELRSHVIQTVTPGRDDPHRVDLPYTSRTKKVLELAMSEARGLDHSYVGTEHLLLGLVREEKGVAAQVLAYAGVEPETLTAEIVRVLGTNRAPSPAGRGRMAAAVGSERTLEEPWRVLPEPAQSIVAAAFKTAKGRGAARPTEADLLRALVFSSREVAAAFAAREIDIDDLVAEIRSLTESPDSSA